MVTRRDGPRASDLRGTTAHGRDNWLASRSSRKKVCKLDVSEGWRPHRDNHVSEIPATVPRLTVFSRYSHRPEGCRAAVGSDLRVGCD